MEDDKDDDLILRLVLLAVDYCWLVVIAMILRLEPLGVIMR